MSFGCSWEPLVKPPDNRLPVGFKYAVARRWFDHDGSLRGEYVVGSQDLPYLRGLMDGSPEGSDVREGAAQLIDAVERHGVVIFRIGP